MSLQTPLFNFHDIALILVVFQNLLLALLLMTVRQGKIVSNRLLSIFVASIGLSALDTLMYWCDPLKQAYLHDVPLVFFVFKFAILLQGPLLFLYIKSVIYTDFALHKRDYLHFLPALVTPFYCLGVIASLGAENLHAGVHDYAAFWDNPFFRTLVLVQTLIVPVYAFASLRLILGYRKQLKENYSNLDSIGRNWLKILIIGFCLICLWNLFGHIVSWLSSGDLPALLGLLGNYLAFLFANCLVFYSLLHSNVVQGVRDPQGEPVAPPPEPDEPEEEVSAIDNKREEFSPEQIAAVERAIHQDKVFLQQDLTLEELASSARLPTRVTSNIINRHFGMSFFDFINYQRVETAKAMLLAEPDKSVLEIAEMAGFNSKSAFNRFFKKFSGKTPTEFRRENSAI
ncbi:AraC family transcriptional regulator [Saccharophagus sp. K07]|uniref:AraC family transcriptional regulator n=1 Tax=Saccharophagus sp. K07 TaxID=2283636 RepID=UPI0016527100|nr:helix-turn-helix domain-containing protein [Saccharophagus sp. K07]MBC6905429.1 AraC family transcriptional regulator [Saccharophagus sp. K07]